MIYNETRYNSHWNTKKLSELGLFARGKSKHRPRDDERLYEGGGYPLIQTGDVKAANLYITNHEQEYGEFGLAQSKLWDAGTLCITIAANIAETAILGYPMCFPDSVVGFSAFPAESSEKFMHYIFTYIRNSIQNSVIGSIQDNINIDYLSQLDFKVPSRGYQDKIVGVLGTIDEKIDTNGRICTELEAVAQMLYNYWFTQFDFPNTDGKPYRSSGGEMVWNDQLKRKIPKGWEPGTINSILQIDNTTVDPRKMGKTIMEHYSIPAFDANHSPAYEPADIIESGKYMVSAECILTSKLNPHFKRLWDPYCDTENAICSTEFIVYRPKEAWMRPFCYAVLDSEAFYAHMVGNATASTGSRKRIQPDVSASFLLPIPDEDTIHLFVEAYGPIMDKQKALYKENRELTKLRDWLLPMLMNGQVTVE